MAEAVLYEKRDRIAFITLNRPEVKNAIDTRMHEALCRIWEDFQADNGVDVAILSGKGDAFCAGADLRTWVPANYVEASPSRVREIMSLGLGGLTRGMHRISKPVIAAINGWAISAGLELALACDLRLASEKAMFGSFEARRGFHHGDGGIVRLVNTCGVGVAMQMVLTAEPIDAQRALQCSLVMKVVPHDRLLEEAELVARQVLRNSQRASVLLKKPSSKSSASRWTISCESRPGTPIPALIAMRPRNCSSSSTTRLTQDGPVANLPPSDWVVHAYLGRLPTNHGPARIELRCAQDDSLVDVWVVHQAGRCSADQYVSG
jgi:enoyl-CoA hydratase/carnithine racemase